MRGWEIEIVCEVSKSLRYQKYKDGQRDRLKGRSHSAKSEKITKTWLSSNWKYFYVMKLVYMSFQYPVAAGSKAWVCGRSLDGIAGSNPAWLMDVRLLQLTVCCQVEFSSSGWSFVQRSPIKSGVSDCYLETSEIRRPWTTGGLFRHRETHIAQSYNPSTHLIYLPRSLQTASSVCLGYKSVWFGHISSLYSFHASWRRASFFDLVTRNTLLFFGIMTSFNCRLSSENDCVLK